MGCPAWGWAERERPMRDVDVAWNCLDEAQREVIREDVLLIAEEDGLSLEEAFRVLLQRIGGADALDSYADVLLAGKRRKGVRQ